MEGRRIYGPVSSCNEYENKATPPLWELEKIAWRISPELKHRPGFVPAGKVVLTPVEFREKFGDDR